MSGWCLIYTLPSPSGFVSIRRCITNEMKNKTEIWRFGEIIGIIHYTCSGCLLPHACHVKLPMSGFCFMRVFFSYQKRVSILFLRLHARETQSGTDHSEMKFFKKTPDRKITRPIPRNVIHTCLRVCSPVSWLVNALPCHLVMFSNCAEYRALWNHKISKVTRSGILP